MMHDVEKVISTLEEIKTQTAEIGLDSAVIAHKFIDKILALLKEQEQKTGHWIATGFGFGKCSECGFQVGNIYVSKYCQNCGAKMEGR